MKILNDLAKSQHTIKNNSHQSQTYSTFIIFS